MKIEKTRIHFFKQTFRRCCRPRIVRPLFRMQTYTEHYFPKKLSNSISRCQIALFNSTLYLQTRVRSEIIIAVIKTVSLGPVIPAFPAALFHVVIVKKFFVIIVIHTDIALPGRQRTTLVLQEID